MHASTAPVGQGPRLLEGVDALPTMLDRGSSDLGAGLSAGGRMWPWRACSSASKARRIHGPHSGGRRPCLPMSAALQLPLRSMCAWEYPTDAILSGGRVHLQNRTGQTNSVEGQLRHRLTEVLASPPTPAPICSSSLSRARALVNLLSSCVAASLAQRSELPVMIVPQAR